MGFSFAFLSTCVQCDIGSFVFRSRSGSLLSLLGRILAGGAPSSAKGWAESKYPSQTNG